MVNEGPPVRSMKRRSGARTGPAVGLALIGFEAEGELAVVFQESVFLGLLGTEGGSTPCQHRRLRNAASSSYASTAPAHGVTELPECSWRIRGLEWAARAPCTAFSPPRLAIRACPGQIVPGPFRKGFIPSGRPASNARRRSAECRRSRQ